MLRQRSFRLALIIGIGAVALLLVFLVWRGTQVESELAQTGGVRVVVQAEPLAGGGEVTAAQLEAARSVIADGNPGSVRIIDRNRIVVELPYVTNVEAVAEILSDRALLELVDGGDNPPDIGDLLNTSLGKADRATSNKIWNTIIPGDEIDGATVKVTQDQAGRYAVTFALRGSGPKKLTDFTTTNVGHFMPVLLEKHVISVPRVMVPITDGNVTLSSFTQEEANRLATQIKYGALPVRLLVVEATVVAPSE